jgi:hypothetical protein
MVVVTIEVLVVRALHCDCGDGGGLDNNGDKDIVVMVVRADSCRQW